MKFRPSIATQISTACALITLSVLLVAHALGLMPDPRTARLGSRQTTAELVSRWAADSATHDDPDAVQDKFRRLVEQDTDVLSIGVRLVDGSLAASTHRHEQLWSVGQSFGPDSGHIRIPILRDGAPYTSVEIRFQNLARGGLLGLIDHSIVGFVLFAAIGVFLACRFYLGRVLRGPALAPELPERARNVLDTLAEGAMILDHDGRIVLVNRGLSHVLGSSLVAAIGGPAASLGWIDCHTHVAPIPYPWLQTLEDGVLRTGTRLELHLPDGRCLLTSITCVPMTGADGVRRGVVVALTSLSEIEAHRAELVARRPAA